MPDTELPQWLDEIDVGTITVLTLDDGECLTANILRLNDECDELIVDVNPGPGTIQTLSRLFP